MREQAGQKMAWGGRFAESPDLRLQAFNASVGFDVRMIREDIRGSIAHVRMLGRQAIIWRAAGRVGIAGCLQLTERHARPSPVLSHLHLLHQRTTDV